MQLGLGMNVRDDTGGLWSWLSQVGVVLQDNLLLLRLQEF